MCASRLALDLPGQVGSGIEMATYASPERQVAIQPSSILLAPRFQMKPGAISSDNVHSFYCLGSLPFPVNARSKYGNTFDDHRALPHQLFSRFVGVIFQ